MKRLIIILIVMMLASACSMHKSVTGPNYTRKEKCSLPKKVVKATIERRKINEYKCKRKKHHPLQERTGIFGFLKHK